MARSTRGNLLRAGLDLFCEHGFNAVGLDQILRQAGVTKTTFYNHFESKEQLVCDVIDVHVQERVNQVLEGVDRLGGSDPQKRLLAIFDVLHEIFLGGSYCGCLIINALIEFPSPNDQVHAMASEHACTWNNLVARWAEEAGVSDAKSFAIKLGLLYDGAIIARQAFGISDAAAQAREAAKTLLEASR